MGFRDAIRERPNGRFKSLVGVRSGRLVANEYYGYEPSRHGPIHFYACECDCGGKAIVSASNLRRRTGGSCGCLKRESLKERSKTHGMSNASEYICWRNIQSRCHNPKNRRFKDYGGRGIVVCDQWRESFEAFISDMGKKPSRLHSIERDDVNGNYEPNNCRWILLADQVKNTRMTRRVSYQGKTLMLADAVRESGLPAKAISNRLSRGWPVDRALQTSLNAPRKVRTRPNAVWVDVDGEAMLLRAACTRLGKSYKTVHARIKRGRTPQEALDM